MAASHVLQLWEKAMHRFFCTLTFIVALGACATAKLGDKATEVELKKLAAIPGKVSLYVCRENSFKGGGVGAEAIVNNKSVGSLKTNTFVHTILSPGKATIFLRRTGFATNSGDSGSLTFEAAAGDVRIIWAGQAGLIGPVTVDEFSNRQEAESCVRGAEYAIE